MPYPQNEHGIALHSISQYIRRHDCHLAPTAAGIAPALGKLGQAVGDRDQPLGEPRGRRRVERLDIGDDRFQIVDRPVRPDDAPQAILRR